MQPKPPAPEPEIPAKSKKKKTSEAPAKADSPDRKSPKQVQTRLTFQKKPVEDRSYAFAVKPEPPRLPLPPNLPLPSVSQSGRPVR